MFKKAKTLTVLSFMHVRVEKYGVEGSGNRSHKTTEY